MEKERIDIVEYGKSLITKGLTKGTGGNLSIYDANTGMMAISPSGIDYFSTKPEDVVIMRLDGTVVEGERKPSTEYHLHSLVYKNRTDVTSVIHTHSTYSTIMSMMHMDLPAVHYMLAITGSDVVKCAEYATFGTEELALKAVKAMGTSKACFLANHGLLVCGQSIKRTLSVAENVEWIAEMYIKACAVGKPIILTKEQMAEVRVGFTSYGQHKK